MSVRKLRRLDDSGGVTIPKDDLADAGLLDDDGAVAEDQWVKINEEDEGKWSVEVLDV